MNKTVAWDGWLAVKVNNPDSVMHKTSARLTKGKPKLGTKEVAVKVNVVLPAALFKKPILEAQIIIPPDAVEVPVIEADVFDEISDELKGRTGCDVRVIAFSDCTEA